MTAPLSSRSSLRVDPATASLLLNEVRKRISPDHFETWFRGFQVRQDTEELLEFIVPNGFVRDWITAHYMGEIEAAVRSISITAPRLRIGVASGEPDGDAIPGRTDADHPPAKLSAEPRGVEPIGPTVERIVSNLSQNLNERLSVQGANDTPEFRSVDPRPRSVLNKHHTFEEFVVGPCNQLAHSVARAIAAEPGRAYNPYFVHGNVGLGKTHLLQAICQAVVELHPQARLIYVSCEEFTNRFIEASQNRTLEAFRSFYRSADVLVIDDVEFLAHKTRTQFEFFHTFNTLYNANKQIVVSSDRRAPEIPTLEERLVSRFKWGFETNIEPPAFETRVAIARRKALARCINLPLDVAELLAEVVTTNVRELEGAVVKVLGLAALTGQAIDRRLAADAMHGGEFGRPLQVSLADILNLVSSEFTLSAKEITGKSRTQAVSLPRQIGMHLAREYTEHSLEEIGRFFGNRDHTTVLYAVTKIAKKTEDDPMFRNMLLNLSRRIGATSRRLG